MKAKKRKPILLNQHVMSRTVNPALIKAGTLVKVPAKRKKRKAR